MRNLLLRQAGRSARSDLACKLLLDMESTRQQFRSTMDCRRICVSLTSATITVFRPSLRVMIEHPKATAFFLQESDIVFARTGASVGKSYLYDPKDGPLVFVGLLIQVGLNPEDVQQAFLSYCVNTERSNSSCLLLTSNARSQRFSPTWTPKLQPWNSAATRPAPSSRT